MGGGVLGLCFLAQVTVYPNWGRRPWDSEFMRSDVAQHIPEPVGSLVLLADERLSYLVPPLHARGVRVANLYAQNWWDGSRPDTGMIDAVRDPHPVRLSHYHTVYLLLYDDPAMLQGTVLGPAESGSAPDCVAIDTNQIWQPRLCRLQLGRAAAT